MAESDEELELYCLAVASVAAIATSLRRRRLRTRRKRSMWVRSLFRRDVGTSNALLPELRAHLVTEDPAHNPYSFRNYTRMDE
jgi:hypothetical protein